MPSRQTPDAPETPTRAVDGLTVPVDGPLRTCVGCRSVGPRSQLVRSVLRADGTGEPVLVVDEGRCLPGRGAWLHPDLGCLELADRRRAFMRALRHAGPLDAGPVRAYLGSR